MAQDAAPNSSYMVCKTLEDRIFTRTLCGCGHTCALRSLHLMTPGERFSTFLQTELAAAC